MGGKVKVGLVVAPGVDRAVELTAARLDVPKSLIYEAGARLIVAILEAGYIDDSTLHAVARVDKELPGIILDLLKRKGVN